MIILDTTSKSLEVDMDEIISTSQPVYYASFVDVTTTSYSPASTQGSANSTATVTMVAAPSASTQRQIKLITINNIDTITHNIIVQINISATTYQLFKAQLLTGEKLCYTDGEGWRTYNAQGYLKNNFSVGGITALSANASNITSGNISFSNSNSISFGVNGQTITASYLPAQASWFQNAAIAASSAVVFPNQSTSIAVQFQVPNNLSVDFLRIPALMTTNSTSLTATVSGANASGQLLSTLNAVIYSQATGTGSSALSSVLKGSIGWTQINSVSMEANATRGSYSQSIIGGARGSTSSIYSTYALSNSNSQNYSTTLIHSLYSSVRYLDIPLNNGNQSLTPGPYWMIFGISTDSATNSTAFAAITNCNVRTSAIYCNSQANLSFGVMGSSNLTSAVWGAGSFTTAGGGTTANLPISAISTAASNPQLVFQLLGSQYAVQVGDR